MGKANEKVKTGNEKVKAENKKVKAENKKAKAENKKAKAENKKMKAENKKVKAENKKVKKANKLPNQHIGFDDPGDFLRLRKVFYKSNYTEGGIRAFLGVKGPAKPIALEVPPFVLPARGDSPLETLTRLFLLSLPVTLDAMRSALHPTMTVEEWCQAGLVVSENDAVRPLIRILPFNKLLLACDISGTQDGDDREDMVMGIAGSSLTLATSTVRRLVHRTLDLGTGCGIQAFLAAGHSKKVVAVDSNPRAISFATFNAQLNGIKNIEFLTGDLFYPVQGSTFDLIVMNPPFVISPEFRAHYRDSGMDQDQFCQNAARRAPDFLEEGGYFQMFCSWPHIAGQPWPDRLAAWFEGTEGDVWALRSRTRDVSAHTLFWNRGTKGRPDFGQIYKNWMDYYREQRIEAVSTGLITLRKTSGRAGWFRCSDSPRELRGDLGADILRMFSACDSLESAGDDQGLMNMLLRIAPDILLEQQCEPHDKGWRVVAARLRRTQGFCFAGDVSVEIAGLITAFDGRHSVGEILNELAVQRKVDLASIVPEYLAVLRRLITRGFLVPVGFSNEILSSGPEVLQEAEPASREAEPILLEAETALT